MKTATEEGWTGPRWLSAVAALGAATTVAVTWVVWGPRDAPAAIPLLALPAFHAGVPLVLALALAVVRPRDGLIACMAILLFAVATDHTRLQPQMFSFLFLIGAGIGGGKTGEAGPLLARVHLITMWFYAGFNKLLSRDFLDYPDPTLLEFLVAAPPNWLIDAMPMLVIASEIGLAIAVAVVRTRCLAAVWALVLHGVIFLSISPLGEQRNPAVWPWNIVLALSGPLLIATWRESLGAELRRASSALRAAVFLMMVYPLGFYVGLGDPYLAHNLYSENLPMAFVCQESGQLIEERPGISGDFTDGKDRCRVIDLIPVLGVPEPPHHSYLETFFRRGCRTGEFLVIIDKRRYFALRGWDERRIDCGT